MDTSECFDTQFFRMEMIINLGNSYYGFQIVKSKLKMINNTFIGQIYEH